MKLTTYILKRTYKHSLKNNERLLEANDLIKQHVKVAEEAVAGKRMV